MSRVLAERYELGDAIGAGGMARVYAATDRFLDRAVAVKVLDDVAARSADPASRDRFLNEARSAASFSHPNAVAVFDAGRDGDELYIVMELVEGGTLADELARLGRLSIERAIDVARQMLEALRAMHRAGILHRDVKPANVLIGPSGRVKLTDFGIAKRLDDIDEALTGAGQVIGTPKYLSPEQALGSELGPTTDVYLVGAVLHEMLTGERPPAAVVGPANRPPDPRRHRAEIPEWLARVVVRALAFQPEDRYRSAEAMLAELPDPAEDWAGPATTDVPVGDDPAMTQAMAAATTPAPVVVTGETPITDSVARSDAEPATGVEETTGEMRSATRELPRSDAASAGSGWWRWVIAAIGLVIVAIAGYVVLVDGDDARGEEFVSELEADPEQFGERGPEVRDRVLSILDRPSGDARDAAVEQLKVDVFVWVADGELDPSVGDLVQRALD